MRERRSPTTAARSCCSIPRASPQVGGVKLEAQERAARIAEEPGCGGLEIDRQSFCSAPSTAAAERFASRSSTGSRKCRPAPSSTAAGQLRVQLGDAILPLAGASRRRARRRQGPPVPPQRRRARDRLRLRRSHRLRDDRQRRHPCRAAGRDQRRLADQRRAGRAGRRALAVRQSRRRGRSDQRAAGLPPAERRSVDAEHASPDRRGRGLSRRRRRATKAMPISSSPRRAADVAERGGQADDLAPDRAGRRRQEGRQHLPLRPRRAADGAQVRRAAGRGK